MKNFKEWITSHNPEIKWDFDNKDNLHRQLCDTIAESGYIDIETVWEHMFSNDDSGLTVEQNAQWLDK